MAINNSIALATAYIKMLDEVYKRETLTGALEHPERVGDFVGANAIKYFKTSMDGLGAYSRNTGFVSGDVTGTWETLTLEQDRGRRFTVDAMDDEETLTLAFGTLAGEFIRTKVVPEIDAYRFAAVASKSGIQTTTGADLTSSTVAAAIDAAVIALDTKEVPEEGRILYATPQIIQALRESTAVTRLVQSAENAVDRRFMMFDGIQIVKVPGGRFVTAIDLNNGSTGGQEAGGYAKASGAKNINFLLAHPSAIMAVKKHAALRLFSPEVNQDSDGWSFQYRIYHDCFVYDNKVEGVYLHKSTT